MGKITKDSLGDRQKQYEKASESELVPKMPIIIRLDGKAFHTFTKGMDKPFDNVLGLAMRRTMQSLCKDVHTCVLGYTQSDEITLILKLPDRIRSQSYMNRRIQKIASLTASKCTRYFNKYFIEEVENYRNSLIKKANLTDKDAKLVSVYKRKIHGAEFDSRAFNVPEWDCINNIIWRQQDAIRNSVEMVGHVYFTTNELHKVNVEQIKEKLLNEKGINWDTDFTEYQHMGIMCIKQPHIIKSKDGVEAVRNKWELVSVKVQDNRDWFKMVTGLSEE